MKKNFVFDTNVLLTDPQAMLKFADNSVVLPITVIEELDKFKRDVNAVGRNARQVSRMIDGFRAKGKLSKGVKLDNGGTLRVMTDLGKQPPLPFPTLGKTADSLILAAALLLKKREDLPVVFVTRDINLRLRADAVGLKAVNYEEDDVVAIEEMYTGRQDLKVPGEAVDQFRAQSAMDAAEFELLTNQCVDLIDEKNAEHRVLGRFHRSDNKIHRLVGQDEDMCGISARNREQSFTMDLLLDDAVQIVTLAGKAGTGKTLLAIAAGLRKVVEEHAYSKLVVARPVMPLGKELGFLPGEVGEKLRPWMEPVFDNLELIVGSWSGRQKRPQDSDRPRKGKKEKRRDDLEAQDLIDRGILVVQALTYIRGRSLPGQYLVIDEAQNLTQHEVKTIITRAGEGTKVVLTGDPYQIDNPFLDSGTNGLSIAAERFKSQEIAGHMLLVQGERSPLAELASNLL